MHDDVKLSSNRGDPIVKTLTRFATIPVMIVAICFCAMPQNPRPIGIRPEPAEGQGVVALKAARLIDGTGTAPIANAVIIVTDNKIPAVGTASSVNIPAGANVKIGHRNQRALEEWQARG